MSTKLQIDKHAAFAMRKSLLFKELSDEQFSSLLEKTRMISLGEGEFLFEQGQKMKEFFLLDAGQMKLTRLSSAGNEKVIDIIMPGQTFAEGVMFSGRGCYPVNAEAIADSRVICIDTQRYTELLRESVDACFGVMGHMSCRLHWQLNEIDRLTLHNATYRLVNYLLDQATSNSNDSTEVCLCAPKSVIASRLSIKPETFSRILHRLTEEGLIEVYNNQVVLSDIQKVRDFVHLDPLY